MNSVPPHPRVPSPDASPPPIHAERVLDLRFVGTGAGLARIWFVNLLGLLPTLGLYAPWARRRLARWYRRHTLLAGSPLEGADVLVWRPWDVLGVAGLCLWSAMPRLAGDPPDGATALIAAAVLGAAVAGACWFSAPGDLLASTRWRSLRPWFRADVRESALATWPAVLLGAVWAPTVLWCLVAVFHVVSMTPDADGRAAGLTLAIAASLPVPLLPISALLALRLRHAGHRLAFERGGVGPESGRVATGFGALVRAALGAAAMLVVGAVIGSSAGGPLALFVPSDPYPSGVGMMTGPAGGRLSDSFQGSAHAVALARGVSCLVLALAVAMALGWYEARAFAALWNGAGLGALVRCRCALSPWPFVRLRAVNLLLCLATLGLYAPFARVREHRSKVGSIGVAVRGGADAIEALLQPRPSSTPRGSPVAAA